MGNNYRSPKILIGAPTYYGKRYCLGDFSVSINSIVYNNADILYIDNSVNGKDISADMNKLGINCIKYESNKFTTVAKRMADCCNIIRDKVLKEGYDYYFSLESDMIVQPTILYELLATKKKLIGSMYNIYGGSMRRKCGYSVDNTILIGSYVTAQLSDNEELPMDYMDVEMCGLGATLIHRSVLEKVAFRGMINTTPDSLFFMDAIKKNFMPKLYTGDVCYHMNTGDWEEKIK